MARFDALPIHLPHAAGHKHQRNHSRIFKGRCSLCGRKQFVRWKERGFYPEEVKLCRPCERGIDRMRQLYPNSPAFQLSLAI